eukprot:CAMPEP_0180822102 /NCGR_PEP_ID=MMETSP1038_2-20121128/71192_1 /TAXON_ID=632150 /ORGANISM="Azadinium spinosum, Strain 3D9" /LENGTH=145 /DNA_ID=CAMNT_0022864343 /DNA_START=45 /DNA_END=483 /DNA_ORIENTATION=-
MAPHVPCSDAELAFPLGKGLGDDPLGAGLGDSPLGAGLGVGPLGAGEGLGEGGVMTYMLSVLRPSVQPEHASPQTAVLERGYITIYVVQAIVVLAEVPDLLSEKLGGSNGAAAAVSANQLKLLGRGTSPSAGAPVLMPSQEGALE